MNNVTGIQIPGMETHEYGAQEVFAMPSPEFLHNVAQLLETELDNALAGSGYVGPERTLKIRRPLEDGIYPWNTTDDHGAPQELVSSPVFGNKKRIDKPD